MKELTRSREGETKRITFLVSSLAGGGAEGVCVTLANGFAESGWDVTLLVLNFDNAVYMDRLSDKVKVAALGKKHTRSAVFALWWYVFVHKPDKFLVFDHRLAVALELVRLFSVRRFAIVARVINTLSMKQRSEKSFWHKYVVGTIVRFFYKRVNHVVAQSQGMKDDLLLNYGFAPEQITVIHNPVNQIVEKFADDVGFSGMSKDDYLLCVGRLEPQKAFEYALEAFQALTADYPSMRLKILGVGSTECYLKEFAVKKGIADKVDFEGFQKDLVPFYLRARATVLTSLYEGFPNVLVESIFLGTPVVAFDCPSGPRDIIQDGENGFLVKYRDKEHLLDCLRKALSRSWNRETICETACQYRSSLIVKEYIGVISR